MQSNRILLISSLIFLSCSGNSGYTVSGTVKGLQGSLIIQNNSKDNLTIDQDGNFSFKTTLADKEKFNIQVDTEPCTQRCEIKSGTGTVDGKNVDNVEINCLAKTWTESANFLESTELKSFESNVIDVAMNKRGDAIVLWISSTDSGNKIYKSEYRNRHWFHPNKSEYLAVGGIPIRNAHVAMNNKGDAIIVTSTHNVSHATALYVIEYSSGIWIEPSFLSDQFTPVDSDAHLFQVGMDDSGDVIIAWNAGDINSDGYRGAYITEKRKGIWTNPKNKDDRISIGNTTVSGLKLAMNYDGQAVIAWGQGSGGIFKSEYYDNSWHNPKTTSETLDQYSSGILGLRINDTGEAIIFWTDSNQYLRVSQKYHNVWSSSLPQSIYTDTIDQGLIFYDVKLSNSGDALLSWAVPDKFLSSNTNVYISQKRNGKWDSPVDTKNFFLSGQGFSPLAIDIDDFGISDFYWVFQGQDNDDGKQFLFNREFKHDGWLDDKIIDTKSRSYNAVNPIGPMIVEKDCRQILFWTADEEKPRSTYFKHFR